MSRQENPVKRVLLCDLTDVQVNLRPNRHLKFLREFGYEVDVVSLPREKDTGEPIHKKGEPALSGVLQLMVRKIWSLAIHGGLFGGLRKSSYFSYLFRFELKNLSRSSYDFALVENLKLLPMVLKLENVGRVVMDLREYHPLESEESLLWRVFVGSQINKIYLEDVSRVDTILTVSPGISDRVTRELNRKSRVILNVPYRQPLPRTGKAAYPLRIVYHGTVNRQRGILRATDIISKLPRVSFDLYPVGRPSQVNKARKLSLQTSNVTVKEPVVSHRIVEMLKDYDLGLVFYTRDNFNLQIALPNKFFEFIFAGVSPIVAPGGAMADFVHRTGFGFVAEKKSFDSLAELLLAITPDDIEKQRTRLIKLHQELDISVQRETFFDAISGTE